MQTYEALFIVRPDQEDDAVQTTAREVESLITDNGGAIVRSEIWSKRRLAYPVKKFSEGIYVLIRFQCEAPFLTRLDGHFRLSETVIKAIVILFEGKTLRLEEEQERRTREQILARSGTGRREGRDDDDSRGDSRGDERGDKRRDDS